MPLKGKNSPILYIHGYLSGVFISPVSLKVHMALRETEHFPQFLCSDACPSMCPPMSVQVVEYLKLFLLANIHRSPPIVSSCMFLKGEIMTEGFTTFSTFISFLPIVHSHICFKGRLTT